MIRNLLGAAIGKKIAGRNSGATGALLGAFAPAIARRAFTPLGLVIGGGYLAKKYYDHRRAQRSVPPQVRTPTPPAV
jgi:hypothetical protein